MSNTDKNDCLGYDDVVKITKSTQEQAVASWINYLNQVRLDELFARLTSQDINFSKAMTELQELKNFISIPERILGSAATKHGEIAEHVQVNISNARNLIEGLDSMYTFDGVGRTAPEDYLFNGQMVQSKFYNGETGTFNAIKEHLNKYPNFIGGGGAYEIPKDQYENIREWLSKPSGHLTRSQNTLVSNIREWEKQTGEVFTEKVKPTVAAYSEVQQGTVNKTINKEEKSINETDESKRHEAYQDSKPTLKQGAQVTAVGAIAEGGITFCLGVAGKLREGKKISDFTTEDWQQLGVSSGKGAGKGAIRGAAVYTLTNFTASPAAVASSFVTASFGVASQAQLLKGGVISQEDFLINSEAMCLDVTVSAIASLAGQALIPIPILGAVIGNVSGMFLYGIAKKYLRESELRCIDAYNSEISVVKENLNVELQSIMNGIDSEFKKFTNIIDLAFDEDVNIAFESSIALAYATGVDEESILHDKKAVDDFFTN